jgi:hypothetical protein
LDTIIPPAHEARYQLNPNYVVIIKQVINKLLATNFIKPMEETTWLFAIMIVPKKNGKLKICCNPTLAKCEGEAQHLEKLEVGSLLGLPNV